MYKPCIILDPEILKLIDEYYTNINECTDLKQKSLSGSRDDIHWSSQIREYQRLLSMLTHTLEHYVYVHRLGVTHSLCVTNLTST